MSKILTKYFDRDETEIFVWEILEDAAYYETQLDLTKNQESKIAEMVPKRQLEFLASRYFMLQSFGSTSIDLIQKDEHGKPFLMDIDIELGLSHSNGQVALIKSYKKVGIDIEKLDRQVGRIAHKFLSEAETKSKLKVDQQQKYLTSIWCAKEAIYKAYGKKKLEFATEMNVTLDDISDEYNGVGILTKNETKEIYDLQFKTLDEMLLCWAVLR